MELVINHAQEFLSDQEAATMLAQFHRAEAAKLPPGSEIRALMLRCAGQWDRIARGKAGPGGQQADRRPFEVVS